MATKFDQTKKVGPPFRKKDRPICFYCNIPGHTIDQCFKLHGYPPGYKPKPRFPRSGNANNQTSVQIRMDTQTYQASTALVALNDILQNLSTSQCQ